MTQKTILSAGKDSDQTQFDGARQWFKRCRQVVSKALLVEDLMTGGGSGEPPAAQRGKSDQAEQFTVGSFDAVRYRSGELAHTVSVANQIHGANSLDLLILKWGDMDSEERSLMLYELGILVQERKVHAVGVVSPEASVKRSREPLPIVLWQHEFDAGAFCCDITDYLSGNQIIINLFGTVTECALLEQAGFVEIARRNRLTPAQLCLSHRLGNRRSSNDIAGRFKHRISVWESREIESMFGRYAESRQSSKREIDGTEPVNKWRERNTREQLELLYYWDAA